MILCFVHVSFFDLESSFGCEVVQFELFSFLGFLVETNASDFGLISVWKDYLCKSWF